MSGMTDDMQALIEELEKALKAWDDNGSGVMLRNTVREAVRKRQARPVRKPDPVKSLKDPEALASFVATWGDDVVVFEARKSAFVSDPVTWAKKDTVHSDGAPIDWDKS